MERQLGLVALVAVLTALTLFLFSLIDMGEANPFATPAGAQVSLLQDAIPPTLTCNAVANYTNSASINLDAVDDGSVASISYRLDGAAVVTVTVDSVGFLITTEGTHTLSGWATDDEGNSSQQQTWAFTVWRTTKLSFSRSEAYPSYGKRVRLTAVLRRTTDNTGIRGRRVYFQRWTGSAWTTVGSDVTNSSGIATMTTMPYQYAKTTYRARFATSRPFKASSSASAVVKPHAWVSVPIANSDVLLASTASIYGKLKPRHPMRTYPVRVYLWRYESGGWHGYGYKPAMCHDLLTYSSYTSYFKFAKRGTWRLRAYHPADALHASDWSNGYEYVRVH